MIFAFADCVLDTHARQLTRGGQVVPLEPKMYALLEVLIQRRAAVVSNDELDELLWPNVFVTRTSLTRLVSQLRAVLGDSPAEARMIRTVYKTGYAFAATVIERAAAPHRLPGLFLEWRGCMLWLSDGENIVGRGEECSLVVDAETVSRRHARIAVSQGIAVIEDLKSTNGTFVNKVPVCNAIALKDGDEVSLGSVATCYRITNPTALTVRNSHDNATR
jgi:DNA-binding winged helix-turn-helix (wHTH) protein